MDHKWTIKVSKKLAKQQDSKACDKWHKAQGESFTRNWYWDQFCLTVLFIKMDPRRWDGVGCQKVWGQLKK